MKKFIVLLLLPALFAVCAGCGGAPEARQDAALEAAVPAEAPAREAAASDTPARPEEAPREERSETADMNREISLRLAVDGTELSVDWESSESVEALAALVEAEALTVDMAMYGGFEQVGSLGTSLPRNDRQTTTQAGDIVLYAGNQLVVFYGSNSWAYTRLGRITDKTPAQLQELLGNGDVVVTLSR